MEFYERILELSKEKGVTPYEISTNTGLSEASLSRLFNGKTKKPNQNNIKTLAKYFNVSEDWLRTGQGEKLQSAKASNTTEKFISLLEKKDEQIDRLLTLLEQKK